MLCGRSASSHKCTGLKTQLFHPRSHLLEGDRSTATGASTKRFPKNWEPTFQSYEIPLARFEGLDVEALAAIRFRTEGSGVVILDDIGFRRRSDALSSEAVELMGDIQ